MSNIIDDGLTRSGIGYFTAVPYAKSGRQRVNSAAACNQAGV